MIAVKEERTYTGSVYVYDENSREWGYGGGGGTPHPADAPMLLDHPFWGVNKSAWLPGQAGNYIKIEDVNLLDTRQASFDNVAVDPTVAPADRYEVWGSGGGTGPGVPGAASPFMIDLDAYDIGDGVFIDGAVNNTVSAPDHPRLDVTGDTDIRVDMELADWTPANPARPVRKWTSAGSYTFAFNVNTNGTLTLYWSADGTNALQETSSVAVEAALPGGTQRVWVRATLDVNNGAGAYEVKFWTSTDGNTWTQLGTTKVGATTTSVFAGTAPVEVGYSAGGSEPMTVYEVQIRAGIDGPLVANPKFAGAHITGGVTSFRDGQGNVWTLNGNATIASGSPGQVGWLPGAVGNYLSIPDTNLLDADTAHLHQSVGKWVPGWGSSTNVARTTDDAVYGGASARVTSGGTNNYGAQHDAPRIPATPGETYSFTAYVKPETRAGNLRVRFAWHDSAGGHLGYTLGTSVPVGLGDKAELTVTGVAPANTVTVRPIVEWDSSVVAPVSGDTFVFDRACLRTGSDPSFVPSTRIVGDLDVRFRGAVKNPTGGGGIAAKHGSPYGYAVWREPTGELAVGHSPDGSTWRSIADTGDFFADRSDKWARGTVDVEDGAGNYVVSFQESADGVTWTERKAVTAAHGGNTGINPTEHPVAFGSQNSGGTNLLMVGTYLFAEVRDGIGGPVVASIDLTDLLSPTTTTDTTPEGHTVTINRSGDATAEIEARDTFKYTMVEYLELGNRPEFAFGANKDFEFVAAAAGRVTSFRSIMGNRGGAGQVGFDIGFTNSGTVRALLVDTVTNRNTNTSAVFDDGAYHVMSGRRVGDALYARTDGSENGVTGAGPIDMSAPTSPFRLGVHGALSEWWPGGIAWAVVFRRALTTTERTSLEAWDGQVSTEPVWLRPLAVFYVNANDPQVKASYANNEVLNLATEPYGPLGWTPANQESTVDRDGTRTPPVGSMALMLMRAAGAGFGTVSARTPEGPDAPAIDGSQTISASGALSHDEGMANPARLILVFLDADGGEIGRTAGADTSIPVGTGYTRLSATELAPPAGTARIAVQVEMDELGQGSKAWLDAVTVRNGADVGYVPSLRVREDIDVRSRVALKSWLWDGVNRTFMAKGWAWTFLRTYNTVNGELRSTWQEGGTERAVNSQVGTGFAPRAAKWVRWTLDADNGVGGHTARFYTGDDGATWTQLGTDKSAGAFTTSIDALSNPLELGTAHAGASYPMLGAGMVYQFRDGIDGPVLLDIDIDNWPDDSDTYTMPNGLTAQIVRSGDATAEIVDRSTLGLTGTEHLHLPHRSLFNSSEFVAYGRVASRSTQVDAMLATRLPGITDNEGWELDTAGNSGMVRFFVDDGPNFKDVAVSGAYVGGEWVSVHGERADGFLRAFVNGGEVGSAIDTVGDTNDANLGMRVGHSVNVNWHGLVSTVVFFTRSLTTDEHAELGTWDGSIVNEPTWLRDAATFYWNAADPLAAQEYRNNNIVLNIAEGAPAQMDVRLEVDWYDNLNALISTTQGPIFDLQQSAWIRPYLTANAPAGAVRAEMRVVFPGAAAGQSALIDAALFEEGVSLLTYFDGASEPLGDNLWEGTAHASRSHYYRHRPLKNQRLDQLISKFTPIGVDHRLVYALEP